MKRSSKCISWANCHLRHCKKERERERKGLEGKLQLWSRDGLKLEDACESYAGNLQRVGQCFMEHLPLSFKYVLGWVRGMGSAGSERLLFLDRGHLI